LPLITQKFNEGLGLKKGLTKADLAKMSQEEKDKLLEKLL
jgi:hypothetical protein